MLIAIVVIGLIKKDVTHSHAPKHHKKSHQKAAHIPAGTLVRVGEKYIPIEDAIRQGATLVYEPAKKVEPIKTDFLGRPRRR